MSDRFIKLTSTYGQDVYIQPDDVKAAYPDSGAGSWTQVLLYGQADHRVYVRESPFEVIEAVSQALSTEPGHASPFSFLGRN
jgi:hypothetical protein